MMTRDADKKRGQMLMFCMDDMIPQDHLLRKIDKAIDWNFIYDLVEDKYCADKRIFFFSFLPLSLFLHTALRRMISKKDICFHRFP